MPDPMDSLQTPQYLDGPAITNDYTIDPGVCVLPLAEDPPDDTTATGQAELPAWSPVVALRLHAPYRVRRAQYDTKKQNTPPVMPAPADQGKFVFLGGTIRFHPPALNMTNTNYDWTAQAEYNFVEDCVSRTADGFVLGIPPYTLAVQQENADALGGVPTGITVGAIAAAGTDAKVGYQQGKAVGVALGPGLSALAGIAAGVVAAQTYTYNTLSYFPGTLFNDSLLNAGPAPPPPPPPPEA